MRVQAGEVPVDLREKEVADRSKQGLGAGTVQIAQGRPEALQRMTDVLLHYLG